MGYAVPAAMAARLADVNRPVVAVCGDGGFAMSIHALMTAVQENIPIAVVVIQDIGVVREICNLKIHPAVIVIIADRQTHAGLLAAIFV